jgi:membrane-bound lytic murein transglycosylase MltF
MRGRAWLYAGGVALLLAMPAQTRAQANAQQPPPPPAQGPKTVGDIVSLVAKVPPWKGDLDGMLKRRRIRVLVPYSKTTYFVEKGVQRGASFESLTAFGDEVNLKHKTGKLKTQVIFITTPRDELLTKLLEGRGDIAAAALTITPDRRKLVDFSDPFVSGVREIVVTGPQSPALTTLDDLAGKEVYTRKSSSYWEHLDDLSQRFVKEGKAPIKLRAAPETLEDEDLLEMLNAGLFQIGVMDTYLTELWGPVFKSVTARKDLAVHEGGEMAWAIRPNSPLLKKDMDAFVKTHKLGTAFGNTLRRRYAGSQRFVKNAAAESEVKKFNAVVDLFKKYGSQYKVDALLVMAQGYQESRLDHTAKSHVGAVGIMQVLPTTGKDMKVGDVHQLEPNIHAGVKYIRFMMDTFFANEPMDDLNKALMAFASYNAGPGRIRGLRKVTATRGLDPNKWFNNVEVIVSEKIGAETVTYVSNIFKYYVAYTLLAEQAEERKKALEGVKGSGR